MSYSHLNAGWLKKIQTVFDPLVRTSEIDLWADTRIQPGAAWRLEIATALACSKVALLLVTPEFLASSFILENELPTLLEAAENDGLVILWIAVSASLYAETELVRFQAVNDPSRPLDSLPPSKVRQELVRMAGAVRQALDHSGRTNRQDASANLGAHTVDSVSITLSSVAIASLDALKVPKSQLLELLNAELVSHPILTHINYECIPRPLSSGLFVLLTKRGASLIVESVGAHVLAHTKVELWSDLCRAYLEAYKLPFRSDHQVLMQETEFRRTLLVMGLLLESLTKYIYHSKLFDDHEAYPNLHRLKQVAEQNFITAEGLYARYLDSQNNEILLGQVALALDVITSSIHKVVIEYAVKA